MSHHDAIDGDGWDANPEDDWSAGATCQRDTHAAGCGFHGSHVAGTIAATAGNHLFGTGVAPGTSYMAVRVLESQGGSLPDILAGVRWAVGLPVDPPAGQAAPPINANPARIINMSLGGSCYPRV